MISSRVYFFMLFSFGFCIAETDYNIYQSPFTQRYASDEMSYNFSLKKRFSAWREVWVALAKTEMELGLSVVTQNQIDELSAQVENIDFTLAEKYEKSLKHDVMAHIHAYGDQCPNAKPIIHLGATSCLITDNADLIIIREALKLVERKVILLMDCMAKLADANKDVACLSWTHFQSAQPTTVGKRVALWLQDFLMDLQDLQYRIDNLHFLGAKGATGTQASFLELFEGDHDKVRALDSKIAAYFGFKNTFALSGQTYSRKQDVLVLDALKNIAVSAHKMCTDLRLLAHLQELEESFGKDQVGSSAMPYKRNPIHSERVCSLARYVISLSENPSYTASTQWLERSLDDSANRRLSIPEAFLATDAILELLLGIMKGIKVNGGVIKRSLEKELPFMATENILMECVKRGGNRQAIHEILRKHSVETAKEIKEGGENNLLERLIIDENIPLDRQELTEIVTCGHFTGRASEQVSEFLEQSIYPVTNLA